MHQSPHDIPSWLEVEMVALNDKFIGEWDAYINVLGRSVISLFSREGRLVWSWNHNTSLITAKSVYSTL